MGYRVATPFPEQFLDASGNAIVGGTIEFYLTGTTTPTPVYSDSSGTLLGTSVTLNARGEPQTSGGTAVNIYYDEDVTYKRIRKDAAGVAVAPTQDPFSVGVGSTSVTPGGATYAMSISDLHRDNLNLLTMIPLAERAAIRSGVSSFDCTTYVETALATRRNILVPCGCIFPVSNVAVATNRIKIFGGGAFKKVNGTVEALFTLADESIGVWFDEIEFDGYKSQFSTGNAVPAIFGYLTKSLKVTNCYLHDIIDVGIKLRDGARLTAYGNELYSIDQNGIELRHYVNDPRTGVPYTGTRPTVQGGHRIIGNHFSRIDDGQSGAGDGCGVTMDSVNASYPIIGAVVQGNTFEDVLRSVWSENNTAGAEAECLVVEGNTIVGNILGAATVETKDGIGFIGVKNSVIKNNVIRNAGNFAPAGGSCAGIQISNATTENIDISGNVIIDDTGASDRTDYGINIAAGSRIKCKRNILSGASLANLNVTSAAVTALECSDNMGAENDYSWGDVTAVGFTYSNLAANSAPAYAKPFSWADDNDFVVPCNCKIVGISAKISEAHTAGTISIVPYADSTAITALELDATDFSGSATAVYSRIESANGTLVAAGSRLTVRITTNGTFAPTTMDLLVTLFVDMSAKE